MRRCDVGDEHAVVFAVVVVVVVVVCIFRRRVVFALALCRVFDIVVDIDTLSPLCGVVFVPAWGGAMGDNLRRHGSVGNSGRRGRNSGGKGNEVYRMRLGVRVRVRVTTFFPHHGQMGDCLS